jgi:hypothetical protein
MRFDLIQHIRDCSKRDLHMPPACWRKRLGIFVRNEEEIAVGDTPISPIAAEFRLIDSISQRRFDAPA